MPLRKSVVTGEDGLEFSSMLNIVVSLTSAAYVASAGVVLR